MKQLENYAICAAFYYKDFSTRKWQELFYEVIELFEKRFNMKFTHQEYCYKDKNGVKFKNTQYAEKNLTKYQSFRIQNEIKGVACRGVLKDKTYHCNPEFTINIAYKRDESKPFCELYIHMEPERFKAGFGLQWQNGFLELLKMAQCFGDVEYAFLHPLEYRKMPALYFSGIGARSRMTQLEYQRMASWFDNRKMFAKQLRDVYFANYLSKGHLKDKKYVLEHIKMIVGKDNLVETPEGSAFFSLPFDIFDIRNSESPALEFRQKLLEVFKFYNMVMEPSNKKQPTSNNGQIKYHKIVKIRTKASKSSSVKSFIKSRYSGAVSILESTIGVFSKILSDSEKIYRGPCYTRKYLYDGTNDAVMLIKKYYNIVVSVLSLAGSIGGCQVLIDATTNMVKAKCRKKIITLYDPSKHPASLHYRNKVTFEPDIYTCSCGSKLFKIAVGYEYRATSSGRDDISKFVLAGKCRSCGVTALIIDNNLEEKIR